MNIWEAYQKVKEGKVIRCNITDEDGDEKAPRFVFQVTKHPLGKPEIVQFDVSDLGGIRPETLNDLQDFVEEVEHICIQWFEKGRFIEVSLNDMLAVAQEIWDEDHE